MDTNSMVSVKQVTEYNRRLASMKDNSAQKRAQLEVSRNNVNELCRALSEDLGQTVTPENIEAIAAQFSEKLKQEIENGTRIMDRIENGANEVETSQQVMEPQAQGEQGGYNMGQTQQGFNNPRAGFPQQNAYSGGQQPNMYQNTYQANQQGQNNQYANSQYGNLQQNQQATPNQQAFIPQAGAPGFNGFQSFGQFPGVTNNQ